MRARFDRCGLRVTNRPRDRAFEAMDAAGV